MVNKTLRYQYTGLHEEVLTELSVNIPCVSLQRVYELKTWLLREDFINALNNFKYTAYYIHEDIFISYKDFDKIDIDFKEMKFKIERTNQ